MSEKKANAVIKKNIINIEKADVYNLSKRINYNYLP